MLRSLLGLSLLCGAISPALASGQLDPSSDQDGVLTHSLSTFAQRDLLRGGLVDSSGRYVGVGQAPSQDGLGGAVLRLLPSGQRDPSFGNNGLVQLPLVSGFASIVWREVIEQPDGKLVVGGRAHNIDGQADPGRAYVCRLLATGAPDPAFGTGGCVQPVFAPTSNIDNLYSIALQPDGRLVLVGSTDAGPAVNFEYVVARLESNGSYDLCFGNATCTTGGMLIEPEPDDDGADFFGFIPAAVAITATGRIVVAGRTEGSLEDDMALIQLLPTGAVDVGGFGNGGHRRVAFDQGGNDADAATDVLVRADGSLILVGTVQTEFNVYAGIAALDAFGAPLAGFGSAGKQVFFFNDVSAEHFATRLAQQPDGKLVVVGYTDDSSDGTPISDCAVARFLPDGQLDPVFGFNGVNTLDGSQSVAPVRPDGCYDLALHDDRIVLFGERFLGNVGFQTGYDALLMRLDQDDLFGDSFESVSP